MNNAFGALIVAIMLSGCHFAEQPRTQTSTKDIYQMREECSDSIPRVTKYAFDVGERTSYIRTHYNSKSNRCYVAMEYRAGNPPAVGLYINVVDAQSFEMVISGPKDEVLKSAVFRQAMELSLTEPNLEGPLAIVRTQDELIR